MDKRIEDYMKLNNFINNTPSRFLMGHVVNKKKQNESDFDDEHETDVTVALNGLLDGIKVHDHYNMQVSEVNSCDFIYSKKTPISRLEDIAEPSPYGDVVSGETKVDTSIRACFQITRDKFEESDFKIRPISDVVKNTIQAKMYPSMNIDFKLNKINIYKKGGFFKEHRDTPKPGVVGTLVVTLGFPYFKGGELVLETADGERRFDQFTDLIAFYNHLKHRVEPVTSGTRITVTYYIMCKDMPKSLPLDTPPESIAILNKNLPFGVIMSERYTQSEDSTKGKDLLMFNKLNEHFDVDVYPAIVRSDETYYEDNDQRDYNDFTCNVYRCTEQDITSDINIKSQDPLMNIGFYEPSETSGIMLKQEQQSYIDHVGNECQPGFIQNIYFHRVLVVKDKVKS